MHSAFSVIMGAQLARQRAGSELMQAEDELQSLRSKVAAAEKRLEEAQVEARRLGLGTKKPRTVEPDWKAREYGAWPDAAEYWRQEEGRVYGRRRQKLSADEPARPASSRPRGKEGPLQHWRRQLHHDADGAAAATEGGATLRPPRCRGEHTAAAAADRVQHGSAGG